MNIRKLNRSMIFNGLRLFVFFVIIWHFFYHITNLYDYFKYEARPNAKTGFLFLRPAASTGECYAYDFISFYAAGLLNKDRIEKNLHLDVYDPFLFTQAMERVAAPLKPQGTYTLFYPPIYFALLTPLAYFNLYTAWRIWCFMVAICVAVTYIFTAGKELKKRTFLLCGLFICYVTFPISQNFFIGQSSCLEAALIAISFYLLRDKKYFWAGFIAGAALLKLQQVLIILIPGFFIGKRNFLRGFLLMIFIEALLSILVVGYYNVFNFIRTSYMSEALHCFSDMNDIWFYSTFEGMLQCLPWFISNADKISEVVYIFVLLSALGLWLKVYPSLAKISDQAIPLIGSITTIILINFSLHGYWYDHVFYILPCLWLYIWSIKNDAGYTITQSIVRLIISIIVFYVPFFFWQNLAIQLTSENTITWSQVRIFSCGVVLLCCAITAVLLEFKKCQNNLFTLED